MSKYMGAGEVSIAKRDATTGRPTTPFIFLGCVDTFEPSFTVELGTPHVERCSGTGAVDFQAVKSRQGTINLTFTEWNVNNIKLMLNGTVVSAGSPGTVTNESLPTGMIVGDMWHLGAGTGDTRHSITGLVLRGTGSPTFTLTLDTHYEADTTFGTIEILNTDGYTQPILASYGYTDQEAVVALNAVDDSFIVRFNSLNVANSSEKGIIELYKAKINPAQSLPLISDDFATFTLSMRLEQDLVARSTSSTYGQFGRVIKDANG